MACIVIGGGRDKDGGTALATSDIAVFVLIGTVGKGKVNGEKSETADSTEEDL